MTYTLDESHTSRNYTPNANVQATFGYPRDIKYLTIHHWGNNGQQFDVVRDYLCTNTTPTSAHFVAEGGQVACIVNPDDAAWHAGNAQGNAQSIGIECRPEHTDADYQTVGELVAWLRSQYGDLPLVPHNYWTSTACPGDYDLTRIDAIARGQNVTTQSGTVTPIITKEWFQMALDDQAKADIKALLLEVAKEGDFGRLLGYYVWNETPIQGFNGPVSAAARVSGVDAAVNGPGGSVIARLNNLPAAVWNQNIGAGNAAGVLNHVAAQPAAGTATNVVTGAPFDTDAFIARLVATLPAAIRADLKNAL